MKQFLVDLIVRFWFMMPSQAKVWAYMNDKTFVDPDEECAECKGECEDCK